MKNDSISSGTLFALLYVSLFVGAIVGNWLPFSNPGDTAAVRVLELACLFLILSALLTGLSCNWPKKPDSKTGSVEELWKRTSSPEGKARLAKALDEHLDGVRKGF